MTPLFKSEIIIHFRLSFELLFKSGKLLFTNIRITYLGGLCNLRIIK